MAGGHEVPDHPGRVGGGQAEPLGQFGLGEAGRVPQGAEHYHAPELEPPARRLLREEPPGGPADEGHQEAAAGQQDRRALLAEMRAPGRRH
nr:hypothetical protein KPHV_81510 [Kitasatospora purpeofusca]